MNGKTEGDASSAQVADQEPALADPAPAVASEDTAGPSSSGEEPPTLTVAALGPAVFSPFVVSSWAPDGYVRARGWSAALAVSPRDATARLGADLDSSSLNEPTTILASGDGPDAEFAAFWPSAPAILSTTRFSEANGAALAAGVVAQFRDAVCESCTQYDALSLAGGQPAHLYVTTNAASLVWADGDLVRTLIVPGERAETLVPIAESLVRK